jgi:cytochrome c-type biogenesis protein CcmE
MKQSSNKRFAIGTLVVIGAFAFLIAGSLKTSTLQALPVGALRQSDTTNSSHVGQRLRVRGFVSPKPLRRVVDAESTSGAAGSTQFFEMLDGKQALEVEYRDALPETFKAGSPVQVDGVYYAPGKFKADHVLTKCPSKYQAEEVQKAERSTSSVEHPTSDNHVPRTANPAPQSS